MQNRGRGGVILTPTNSLLLFGVLTSVPIWVKIDQEMRPWECSQTDRHTGTQTQTDFIICPMLDAIAMGQIITEGLLFTLWQAITLRNQSAWAVLSADCWQQIGVSPTCHTRSLHASGPLCHCLNGGQDPGSIGGCWGVTCTRAGI